LGFIYAKGKGAPAKRSLSEAKQEEHMPTIITLLLVIITIILAVTILLRIYWAFAKAEELYLEQELEQMQELMAEQNNWVLRHLGCGLGAFALVWVAKTSPGMEVSSPLAVAMAIYAAGSLLFAGVESLLAQKISHFLADVPVKVRDGGRDQR
jgi:Na+/H+-dicarboxylate symporter